MSISKLGFSKHFSNRSSRLWLTITTSAILASCSSNTKTAVQTETTASKVQTAAGTKSAPSSGTPEAAPAKETGSTGLSPTETSDSQTDSKALADKVLMRPDFIGRVKMCYMAAKQIPALCQQLFCYCGCDYTDEHMTLLDCYTSDHSVDCSYCQGEAMMAFKMHRKGASIAEIQKAVDLNWGPHYPFNEQPSTAIRKYWQSRIWAPGKGPTAAEKHDEGKPLLDPFTGSQETNSKPMGKPSGECCGGKKDAKTKQ